MYDGSLFADIEDEIRGQPHIPVWCMHVDGFELKKNGLSRSADIVTIVDVRLPKSIRYNKDFVIVTDIMEKPPKVPNMDMLHFASEIRYTIYLHVI